MEAFLISTGIVALAEIGDKTQLLTFILAARFRKPLPIILGILVATVINHALAGALGAWITALMGPQTLRWVLGIGFIAMAVWMLIPDRLEERDTHLTRYGVFGATLVAFFFAEMGDKTQVATIALVARYHAIFLVVAGTTLGMLIANVPVLYLSDRVAHYVPVRLVHAITAVIFLLFGVAALLGIGEGFELTLSMPPMPPLWRAGYWGLLAGAALLLGAAIGYFIRVPPWLTAAVMAFGSGVLLSALSFELMGEAVRRGGLMAAAGGFLLGSLIYTAANGALARAGAKHRKRSGAPRPGGAGAAIAVGALIDGIPESMAIGLSLLRGGAVSAATVIAIFLSNIPEGLSSAAGMKQAGRRPAFVFNLWAAIAYASGLAALLGYAVFQQFPDSVIAATTAVAAGGILAMLADTMIPEAFQETRTAAGLITALGFLAAFALSAG